MLLHPSLRLATLALGLAMAASACSSSDGAAGDPATRRPSTTVVTTALPVRPTGAVDRMVEVPGSGAAMHLTCSGAGDRTVVLIAGFGDDGSSWATIEPEVEAEARVCSVTRFGLGTSDAPPTDQTFVTQADDLHALAFELGDDAGPDVERRRSPRRRRAGDRLDLGDVVLQTRWHLIAAPAHVRPDPGGDPPGVQVAHRGDGCGHDAGNDSRTPAAPAWTSTQPC